MKKFLLTFIIIVYISHFMSAQNVGINELAPIGKLHIKVNSSPSFPHLRLTEDESNFARIKMENNVHSGIFWDIAGRADSNPDNSRFNFFYNNSPFSGDKVTIMGNGNVGIGIDSPLSKLDIKSIGDGNELLRFTTDRPWVFKQVDSGPNTKLALQSTVDGKDFEILALDGTSRAAIFRMWNGNTSVFLAPEGGNVGIGTTNPGNKLRVHGSTTSTQHVVSASVNYSGFQDIRAIEGFSTPAPGHGYGGYFVGGKYGLYGLGNGANANSQVVGVYGEATSTSSIGTRIGVYGSASGGFRNWSGFFAGGHVFVTNDLRIGSGSQDGVPGYKVAIDGKVIAEELRVKLSTAWPDYVFDKEYELQSLNDLEKEISILGHLPGIPSAEDVEKDGIMVGDMNRLLLEKIEELTLHIIQLQKQIDQLKSEKNR